MQNQKQKKNRLIIIIVAGVIVGTVIYKLLNYIYTYYKYS